MVKTYLLSLCILLTSLPVMADELKWVGCSITKLAFMEDLATAWTAKTGHTVVINGGGATKGIRQAASNQADMGGTCRYKLDHVAEESRAYFEPIAWDALVTIVHPDNPITNITKNQLRDIFLGKIKNWKELNGKDQPIHVFEREGKITGVGYTMRKLLFANYYQDFNATHIFEDSGPLEKALETDPLAIGVTGISSAKKRALKILKLEGQTPDYESIRNGNYLFYRPLYISYNELNGKAKLIKNFINFAHSEEGMAVIRKNGCVPYTEALTLISKQLREEKAARDMGLFR